MPTRAIALGATLCCLLPLALPAQEPVNLIRNGSFEEGPVARSYLNLPGGSTAMPGWVVTGEGVDLVGAGYWVSSDGTYAIDLDGSARSRVTPPYVHGGIAQTFATEKGRRYLVTFDLAGNPNRGSTIKPLRVSAAGKAVQFNFDATGKTARAMGWQRAEWEFEATGEKTTLEFRSLTESGQTGYGPAIDRVAVVVVE